MFRKLLVALAALAASACSYGSAVDIAPMSARLSKPGIAPGDYCITKDKAPPFIISSSGEDDCMPVTWDQATRTYTMIDPDDPQDSTQAPIVSLGSNLFVASLETPEAKGDRYQLFTFVSKGNAFTMVPALGDAELKTLAAKHKRLTFEVGGDNRMFIAAGKPDHIRDFLRAAARESLRVNKAKDDLADIAILDKAGASDHVASKQQEKDIQAVLDAMKALTPR
jgi:hypothetical protein